MLPNQRVQRTHSRVTSRAKGARAAPRGAPLTRSVDRTDRGMNNPDERRCVYCGAGEPLTQDYVPPKCLFPEPRPSRLITVTSCLRCNLDSSTHDEYLRTMLAMRADLSGNPAVLSIRQKAVRSFERPSQAKFRDAFNRSMKRVLLYGPDGAPVVDHQTYGVSLDRICWVVARTTAGLHATLKGTLSPADTHHVGANLATEVDFERNEVLAWGRAQLFKAPEITIAPGVYSYRVAGVSFDPNCTVWWHTFYSAVEFVALVMPKQVEAPVPRAG